MKLSVLVLVVLVTAVSVPAFACQCAASASLPSALDILGSNDYLLHVRVENPPTPAGWGTTQVRIVKTYKGRHISERAQIAVETTCDDPLRAAVGTEWLIMPRRTSYGALLLPGCSGPRALVIKDGKVHGLLPGQDGAPLSVLNVLAY